MRILVLTLVLANLGFWAWSAWFAPAPPEPSRFDGPGITLLRELDVPPGRARTDAPAGSVDVDPAQEAELASEPGSAPDLRCVAIGPFSAPAGAEAAAARLAAAGFAPRTVVEAAEVRDRYWAYIPRLESMEAARETLARLASEGIEDAEITSGSDSGILISLGVYSEIARAAALADRVSDYGFEATVAERTRTVERRWIEFEQAADDATALELLRPASADPLEQRDCMAEL